MTIKEALDRVRYLKPCQYDDEMLVGYLSELERIVIDEVFSCHEGQPSESIHFGGYTAETPEDTVLLVKEPHSMIYTDYLAMKIDLAYADTKKYNSSASVFYNNYMNFAHSYTRAHKPLQRAKTFTV